MKMFVALAITIMWLFSHAGACKEKIRSIELNSLNTVIFSDEINPVSIDGLTASLVGKRILLSGIDEKETLYLVIVSGGGQYESALRMIKVLDSIPNLQIICKYCGSAAGLMFATFKNQRLAIDGSELIMHEMFIDHMTANMVKNKEVVDDLIAGSEAFNRAMRSIMGMSKADYETKIVNTVWSVKGVELVKLKLASEFVKLHCNEYIRSLAPKTCG